MRARMTTREIVERFKPGVVRIENDLGDHVGIGTGFVVRRDGRIATNLHVIAGGGQLSVRLADGSEHKVVRVIAVDQTRDLAIIQIAVDDLPSLVLGDSDQVSAGDPVVAIGNPLRLDFTVSDGLISSIRALENDTLLQISAPISQGSSGGPLFNVYGEVIGVAVLVSAQGQNLNFGVPSNYLSPMINHDGGETPAQFAKRFDHDTPKTIETSAGVIERDVPRHQLSIFDGCEPEQIASLFEGLTAAISLGAPVYNRGDHQACFVIYRETASHYEGNEEMCQGVREVLGAGLLRAEAAENPTAKAWALRDTFDGLLIAIARKARELGGP